MYQWTILTENGRFQILFVTGQINERYYFGGFFAYF